MCKCVHNSILFAFCGVKLHTHTHTQTVMLITDISVDVHWFWIAMSCVSDITNNIKQFIQAGDGVLILLFFCLV